MPSIITTRKLYIAACALLFVTACHAQTTIKTGSAPNPGIDYKKLANIDTLVNGYINRNWIKGVATIVIKDGQVIQYKGYGYADAASKKSMEANSIFRIASQTKAIVSTGILILYDQGKLSLSDPVSKYIPEFAHETVLDKFNAADTTYTTVAATRDITIKDLLTHTSGIDYAVIGSDNMKAIYAKNNIPSGLGVMDQSLLSAMKTLGRLPLAFQPGTQWRYGLNVDVLGGIIEIITGMSLEDFLRKNIFEPLGMSDTWFNLPADKASRLTTVYTEDSLHNIIPWGKTNFGVDPNYPVISKHYFSGGAGLSSTAYDYALFLQMIMNGGSYGGKTILSRRTTQMMLHPQLDFLFNGKNNFGLGFEITTDKGSADGSRSEGSFAWGGYFGTTYWADPKAHLICLIMTQQNPNSHYQLSQQFEQLVYASLK
ncbi:serine hydrolase domain-containing protein [Parafilimonas sp.]|uniref:serine hydrolase domain-containing protein n=1 Tax=Parafilimonas sp. TaxID=1969739 RepID=UPI0039E41505